MKTWSWLRSIWVGVEPGAGLEPGLWEKLWAKLGLGGVAGLLFVGLWLLSFWVPGLALWGSMGICVAPWACGWLWFAMRSLENEAREYRADVRRLLAWDPDGQWRREYVELEERVRLYRGPQLQWVRAWIVAALMVCGLIYDQAENIVQGRVVMVRRLKHLDPEPVPIKNAKAFDVDSFLEKETGLKR